LPTASEILACVDGIFEHTGDNVYAVIGARHTIGPFRADGTPAKAQVSVMNEETNRETACVTLYEVLAAIEGQ